MYLNDVKGAGGLGGGNGVYQDRDEDWIQHSDLSTSSGGANPPNKKLPVWVTSPDDWQLADTQARLEIDTLRPNLFAHYDQLKVLGAGSFGLVLRGERKLPGADNTESVALKMIASGKVEQALEEITMLIYLHNLPSGGACRNGVICYTRHFYAVPTDKIFRLVTDANVRRPTGKMAYPFPDINGQVAQLFVETSLAGENSMADLMRVATFGQTVDILQNISIFLSVARALKYLHDNNVIHRDVKEPNIIITGGLVINPGDLPQGILIDVGLSCITSLCAPDLGTASYWTPNAIENLLRSKNNAKIPYVELPESKTPEGRKSADVFALGATFWNWMIGHEPKEPKPLPNTDYRNYEPKYLPLRINKDIRAVITQMTVRENERRPEIGVVVNVLEELNTKYLKIKK
jgi:serine/threonine protein kinase